MADPKNPKAPSPYVKAKGAAGKAPSPYKKGGTTAKAPEVNPVVSAGQAFLGAITAPLAGVTGAVNEIWAQAGRHEADLNKVLGAAAQNWDNSVKGKPTVFMQDALTTAGLIGKKGTGAPIEEGSAGAFVAGLAGDILLDPTNLIPGKVLLSGAKIATKTAKEVVRGGADAFVNGEVVASRAIKAAETAAQVKKIEKVATTKQVIKADKLYKAGYSVANTETPRGAIYGKAMETIAAVQPKVVKLDAPRPLTQKIGDALATALETGKAAAVGEFTKERALFSMEKAAKIENKAVRKAAKSGKAAFEGAPGSSAGVVNANLTPLASGKAIEFPKFTPYKAESGKFYVSTGEKAYSFPTEEAARKYIASTGNAAAKTVSGAEPIFDTAATAIPLPSMLKIPTTAPEAKAAQKSLKLIESLAKTAEGTVAQGRGKQALATKYTGFMDLVQGLRAGHSVDYESLTKIIDVLDPSRAWTKGVEGLSQKRASQFVSDLITTDGVQTAAKIQERLDLMNAHTILKGQGVSFSDFAAEYITLRLSQKGQEALSQAVDAETLAQVIQTSRGAAQRRVHEATINPINTPGVGIQIDRVTNGVQQAFGKRFQDINNITSQEKFWEEITNMGDLAVRTTEDAWDAGSRAILKLQLNQSYQAGLVGSLLGLATYREGKHIVAEALKGRIAKEGTPAERMKRFISDINLSQDVISSTLGSRLVHIRVQDPNLTKQLAPNFIYLHLGDLMDAFSTTSKGKLMEEAFFPVGAGIERTTDSMSFSGVVEAARHMLEMKQLNKGVKKADLVRMIMSRGKGQVASSATFMARSEKLANKMADHMLEDGRVAELLTQTHKTRLISAADEALASAETLSRDLFDNMVKAMDINMGKGVQGQAERIAQLRDLFQNFAYLSGAFKAQSSEIGESVLRAAAMVYINDGKLMKLIGEKGFTGEKLIANQEEAQRLLDTLNNMYKVETPVANARKYAPATRAVPQKQIEKAIETHAEAVIKYDAVRNQLAQVIDGKGMAAWQKSFDKAQAALDTARAKMQKLGYPTKHWTPEGWVPSEDYNAEIARQLTEYSTPLDTPAKLRAITKVQYDKVYEEYVRNNIETQIKLRASEGEEAAVAILARVAEIEAQRPDNFADQAQALYTQYVSDTLHAGETKVERAQLTDENIFRGQGDYKKLASNVSQAQLTESAARSFLQRAGEAWSATSGRNASYALLVEAQSTYNNVVQSASRSAQLLIEKYAKVVGEEDFHAALDLAVARTIPKGTRPELAELALDMRKLIESFFGADGAIATSGLDGKSLQAAFDRFGLANIGVPVVKSWKPEALKNLINKMPFGKKPRATGDNANEIAQFEANRKLLRDSGQNPLIVFSKMIQAVEHAKMEKHITQLFHKEFSYDTYFAHIADPTARYNAAVKAGWVKISLFGGTTDLSVHLPKPERGGLYHPAMAREFSSLNREINRLYNSKQMPKFVQGMMELTNVLKFTQTALNPRHHVLNNIGDWSTAGIGGARGGANLLRSLQLSMEAALENGEIDYATLAKWRGKDQFEMSLARTQRYLEPKGAKNLETAADAAPLDVVIGGRRIAFDNKAFIEGARTRGIIVGQQLLNDLKLLGEGVQAIENAGAKGELFRNILGKTRKGIEAVERPIGDFTAGYGNAPRLWTAISEMKSRSWASEQEMWNAISKKVHTLHPTVLSLSSFERRYPRLLASYYTWIRGAHNAFIYMALNHTAAMTVYSKAQYNQAETAGLNPASIGTPWGDKSTTPGYMNYSVYGPTGIGPNGPTLSKPGILPMDVIDTWNIQFDPTIPLDQSIIQNAQGLGQTVLGKNVNMLLQPGLEILTRTDPSTGKPSKIKDVASLSDKALSMLGPTQLLKGLGVYTPQGKGADAKNPLTPRDREVALTNWLGLTQKLQDVNSPSAVKNAQSENSARQKRIMEALLKKQGQ